MEKREDQIEETFEEILVDNFPNVIKDVKLPITEVQRSPSRVILASQAHSGRHIIYKLMRFKGRE